MEDWRLLREYVDNGSEAAFAALVQRHVHLVYSAAFRRLGNSHAAEEVSQAVFCLLATKARRLGPDTALVSWLYQTASFKASQYRRGEARRRHREQEAAMMNCTDAHDADEVWQQLAPHLDDAIHALSKEDRTAVLRRFFEHKPLREIGEELGVGEDAARMRINRALEKLRGLLIRKGAVCSLAILGTLLTERAVQAAPTGIECSIKAAALATAKLGSAPSLVAILLALLAKAKPKLALVTGLVFLTAVTAVVRIQKTIADRKSRASLLNNSPADLSASVPTSTAPEPREPFSRAAQFSLDIPPGAVAVQPDGKILAGTILGGWVVDEQAGTLGWYTRGVMRFEADGSLDRSFYCDIGRPGGVAPNAANLYLHNDGRILISGSFEKVDGKPRPGHAIVLPDGRIDESFEPWRGMTNMPVRINLQGATYSSALLGDGSVAVISRALAGRPWQESFTAYRLDPSGQLVSPYLTNLLSPEFARPPHLMKALGYDGSTANVPLELLRYAARLPDGGAVLAVRQRFGPTHHGRLMRFDKNGMLDSSLTNQFEAEPFCELFLKPQKDGKLLLAGLSGKIDGQECNGVIRLEPDGSIDRSFRCETASGLGGRVVDCAIQVDGRIVICGWFSQINGIASSHIARLNPDGSLDPTFKTPFISRDELHRKRLIRVARLKTTKAPTAPAASATSARTNTMATPGDTTPSETIQIVGMKMIDGAAVIDFNGSARQLYILQASETLQADEWINISTNQASATGAGVLRDPESKNHPARFYRIASP